MQNKINYKKKFISTLQDIFKHYPSQTLGKIIDGAFGDYQNTFHLSEKEMCYAIEKYLTILEMDIEHLSDEQEIETLLEDTKHWFDESEEN